MYFVFVTTGEKRKNVKVGHLAYQRTTLVVSTKIRGAGGMEGIKEKKRKGRSIGSDRREEENNYF